MKSATQVTVTTFAVMMGLAGIEHGVGEILQGSRAPADLIFPSWPNSDFFRNVAGEPAMSIVPNFFITGLLAVVFSALYMMWATKFVQRKHAGLVMILLAIVMLLVGGGIFPPIIGIFIGILATRINTPSIEQRTRPTVSRQSFLSKVWPWSFVVCVSGWLILFPGANLLGYFFGVDDPNLIVILVIFALGSLLLTVIAGLMRDRRRVMVSP